MKWKSMLATFVPNVVKHGRTLLTMNEHVAYAPDTGAHGFSRARSYDLEVGKPTHYQGRSYFGYWHFHIYGLVQDCSISIADALEILQSYTKPSIYERPMHWPCVRWLSGHVSSGEEIVPSRGQYPADRHHGRPGEGGTQDIDRRWTDKRTEGGWMKWMGEIKDGWME